MSVPNSDFLMSTELECLTCTPDAPDNAPLAMEELLRTMAQLVPTVPGPTGIFNGYGRAYVDSGHIELSMAECHSPYVLPLVVERQQAVVSLARERLAAHGVNLLLANNNHSGMLQRGCAVWGAHENYLVEQHPTRFTDLILPFLVTRLYGGAGGIEFPSGNYLAAVRPICMELHTGGSTTCSRAIHSTCRDEHHMGHTPNRFRYHLILGDGHRSQFNLALQFGATALALKAVIYDRTLRQELAGLTAFQGGNWVELLQRFNVLQRPGEELRIDPVVIETQRVYLKAATRYVQSLEAVPSWVPETLRDWDATLSACERLDCPWLAQRLDTFAKYEFYSAVLHNQQRRWADLPGRTPLFAELALLDHSYHNFCDRQSVFSLLEQDGLLEHRVGPRITPGEEVDPFIPESASRARPRARFIREHSGDRRYVMDWSRVYDQVDHRTADLIDPFAHEFDDWSPAANRSDPASTLLATLGGLRSRLRGTGETVGTPQPATQERAAPAQ
jgi:hypothetical protein